MALTDAQVRQLRAKLEAKHVKTRKANGADLHYVEGWYVIAEANRIFGYDAWDRRTLGSRCVWSGYSGVYHEAAYIAKVRVSVRAGNITIVREGSGTGEGKAPTRDKLTTLRLKVPRPMPRSVRLPPLATPSVLPFMIASRLACVKLDARRLCRRLVRGYYGQHLVPKKQASTNQASSPAPCARPWPKLMISSSCSPSGSRMSKPCVL